ncbi:MAG: chromosomal replication initiator protein DnaA [Candidatus Kerfeldbacteria bacterium CG_4_10_14_0_8_um_filter_42_10]|uniref:Chromosomal replication initiator protein DnaA n=1 Tax=Candidatus Kerfeldbacteria bacterium CG_4_10_14_0_8_um_filter_42_10 TaxID=2014248 RepID=A0A2M7RJK7_9BACT|nr:MAG: chromosomal replication initiator protein DnaA [Candidatus Kerfeldbacteria bacterium CG_4_10_14_0_8_um_filter_42_10]
MNKEQLWQAVLGELELSLSKANFTTWFKNTFILELEETKVIIAVPNTFTKTWFENKYHKAISQAFQNLTDNRLKEIVYQVESIKNIQILSADANEGEKPKKPMDAATKKEDASATVNGLNPRYTFENFVVGKGNDLAKAACEAVAEKPGIVYNPLFIYGGVGLGKTHLLQGIGHKTLEIFKNKKVVYVTCERFTNEFIQAVSKGTTEKFKDFYRSADLLLIDDIQFLATKERTQEEFFHTFNALHQLNKQIVISSDRPPKAIPALEQRLVSRFEWGMIADISSPDLETRIAILESKCREKGFDILDRDLLAYIASSVQSNVRELEGALNRLIAHHELNNSTFDLETAKNVLSALSTNPRRGAITPKKLINTVAEFYDIGIAELVGDCRKKELVVPRQITMYLMREEMKSSYPNIGQEIGGRDHTTAMHAYMKIVKEVEEDEKIKQEIELIRQRLYN